MSNIELKNVEGGAAGTVELSSDVFGIEPNIPVMHQVVVAYEACLRQGTHSTKNRSAVSGGGVKPWRQKGTGRARQGTIKRWNFHRGPMTHGSRNQRKPGSIGQCAYPARVRKGLHMAGHMGDERVTVKNLKLVRVDAEQNLMLIKGAVPGGKNALVSIRMA